MQEQIFDALRRGAHEEALATARAAVEADPASALAQQMLAMALAAIGDRDGALQAIDRALEAAPEESEFHFQRAGLLLGAKQLDEAQSALADSLRLDPNQFGAYILQAQLALGSGDADEAERLNKLAALVAPEHPWRLMIDGMVALARGRVDDAVTQLSEAASRAPDDPQVLAGLALAYTAKGHHAFAEQALRKLLEANGTHAPLRMQLAQVLQKQGRVDDALEELKPVLENADTATAPLLGFAGELELAAARPQPALAWLRRALALDPGNVRALQAALSAWRALDDVEDARATLESALATSPAVSVLWRARLSVEAEDAVGIVSRWNKAMPDDAEALEMQMRLQQQAGDATSALQTAHRIVALSPGNASAQALVVEDLKSRDPAAAVTYVAGLLPQARTERSKDIITGWLASLEDAAGRYQDAIAHWTELAVGQAPHRLPLPPISLPPEQVPAGPLPPWDAEDAGPDARIDTVFLWGAPGSCVEQVATVLSGIEGFRADRLSPKARLDGFQRFGSVDALSTGSLDPAEFIRDWREGLAERGIRGDHVIEWLVWWDNAFLRVLRPQLQHAGLVVVLRDPRDMFLQWLAHGSPMQVAIPSLPQAAAWLATMMERIAVLAQGPLYRGVLLRIDGIESDGAAIAKGLSEALGSEIPSKDVPVGLHFPAGHWRNYAEALAEPFAMLTPVAKRLGYPET